MNTEEDEFKRIEAEAKRQTPCKGTSMKEKTKELADSVGAVYPTLFLGRHDGVVFTETELETFVELVAADAILAIKQALEQPEQEPVAWTTMPEAADWDFVSGSKDPTGKLEGKWFPLYTTPPAAQPEQEPCIGKDPRCPCQDGDACHYKDCGDTKALPVAQPEQEPTPWRDMIVATLVREGINKHRARELADHFAAERNNG